MSSRTRSRTVVMRHDCHVCSLRIRVAHIFLVWICRARVAEVEDQGEHASLS